MADQQVLPDPYLGEIRIMAFETDMKGWSKCDGSLLSIADNDALFTLIGTKYGGDGVTNFAIPDLQSRVPIGYGNGFIIGKSGGEEFVTLQVDQLPSHQHTVNSNNEGGLEIADNNFWGYSGIYPYSSGAADFTMNSGALKNYGLGNAHENRIPFQAITYYIALAGIYPGEQPGSNMPPPFLSELRIFSFDIVPTGWSLCDGKLLSVKQNQALSILLGTTYGGDQNNFNLPDLQGRVPMHRGLNMPRGIGAGEAEHTLMLNEMPQHTHQAYASSIVPDTPTPQNNFWARKPGYTPFGDEIDNPPMSSIALTPAGASMPHNNMSPYTVLNICVATSGLVPNAGESLPDISSAGDNYIGEIRMFAGNQKPAAWDTCDGQVYSVSSNTALFSLISDYYGGSGPSGTFGLPNLQARAAVGSGNPTNLTPYFIGDIGGVPIVTLTENETPTHTHAPNAAALGNNGETENMIWATPGAERPAPNFYASTLETPVNFNPTAISSVGAGQPHNNLMPYTVMLFCIALNGTYPSRT